MLGMFGLQKKVVSLSYVGTGWAGGLYVYAENCFNLRRNHRLIIKVTYYGRHGVSNHRQLEWLFTACLANNNKNIKGPPYCLNLRSEVNSQKICNDSLS